MLNTVRQKGRAAVIVFWTLYFVLFVAEHQVVQVVFCYVENHTVIIKRILLYCRVDGVELISDSETY